MNEFNHAAAPLLTVIIVNFNGGDYVAGALASLSKQTYRNFEVILLDNASTDGSVDDLETSGLPAFNLIRHSENLGFAAGNNFAIRQARGTWLALLNPDAEAAEDWLDTLSRAIQRYPDIRQFACAQYSLHAPDHLDGVGDAYLIFGIPWRGGFEAPADVLPAEGRCFSPCGASAVIHADIFRQFNGFDERFFCYCEDVDLGFRMRLAGYDCIFLPDSIVHHAGSGLSSKISNFSTVQGTRNRIWTYWKNMPAPLLWLTLPGHVAISLYILLRAAMTGATAPTWDGMAEGLKGIAGLRSGKSPWSPPKRRISLWSLARDMAWNPLRISRRMPHVRPLSSGYQQKSRPVANQSVGSSARKSPSRIT
ncbi:MAG: glycosyltransferase family 2 protein [Hyphomonas sp.]|jgi:GT2 family glycosyltransferase